MAGLGRLFSQLVAVLPWWAIALIAVGFAVFGLPGYRYSVRTRQIRERARLLVRAPTERREALIQDALRLAGADPNLLGLVAREARKRTQPELYRRVLEVMDADPACASEVAKVRAEVQRDDRPATTAILEVAAVRTLLDGGAVDAARARLTAALTRFPQDAALQGLIKELPVDEG